MRINSNLSLFIFFSSTLFLTGCFKKKEYYKDPKVIKEETPKRNYLTVTSTKECSLEEIVISGMHVLPYALENKLVKNINFYIVDSIFESPAYLKDNLFSLLKNLYINDGWVFFEETNELEYRTACCRKVGKEIYLFIEEKEEYDKILKKYKKYIFLHQSLFYSSSE